MTQVFNFPYLKILRGQTTPLGITLNPDSYISPLSTEKRPRSLGCPLFTRRTPKYELQLLTIVAHIHP
jgi:hypothetical protein